MRKSVWTMAAMASALGIYAAFAADASKDDPLAGYYGNTLLSMNQPHYVIRIWLYPNGDFKEFKATHEGDDLEIHGWEGSYKLQGKPGAYEICKTFLPNPAAPRAPECVGIAPHKVGDIWRVAYKEGPFKGTTETFTVAQGHDTEP